jgi:hypothetical protein
MKQKLIQWLVGVLISLVLKLKSPASVVPATETPYSIRARVLTAAAAGLDGSGEYKRHVVYAQLIKEFPQVAKRVLSLTIEQVLA